MAGIGAPDVPAPRSGEGFEDRGSGPPDRAPAWPRMTSGLTTAVAIKGSRWTSMDGGSKVKLTSAQVGYIVRVACIASNVCLFIAGWSHRMDHVFILV